ncbi:hypothetical protein [Rhodococcus sp. C-2]|uniref:hypothetical protein n=1 Tax=Rhodococcus sp. C-2 TaxID=3018809 RepID=UPI0022EAA11A|nr:hypothetical protein [Rhodococcus sp. C-2]MDA3633976.1 hypothetical protein [Rhodococcus sp. C-2]
MTPPPWLPEGEYGHIRFMAEQKIRDYERRGTGRHGVTEYLIHATALRNVWDKHITQTQQNNDPCLECNQPWPCSSIAAIFAPD